MGTSFLFKFEGFQEERGSLTPHQLGPKLYVSIELRQDYGSVAALAGSSAFYIGPT